MADPISSIPGVSSGIDWKAVVEQVIAQDRRPATRLQAQVDANARRKDALEQYRLSMQSLQTAADGLRKGTTLDSYTVSASGTDGAGRAVASATVGSGAAEGRYAVQVLGLATAQKRVGTAGWSATRTVDADPANASAVTGTLTLAGQTIDVKGGDTLTALRDRINAVTGRTNVQATVLSLAADGSDQRLVLTATRTGAANGFTLADSAGGALLTQLGLDGADTTAAADARLTIDGGPVITRPSNTVGDALPGVTLALQAGGTSTVAVTRQGGSAGQALQGFVDAYNRVVDLARTQTAPGASLAGESMLKGVRAQLSAVLLAPAATGGTSQVANDMAGLSQLGLSVQKDGRLSLDTTKLDAAYPARGADVRALLADRMSAFHALADGVTGSYTGLIDRRLQTMEVTNASATARIADLDARLEKKRTALLSQYAKFEGSLGRIKAVGDSMSAQFTAMINSMGSR